MKMKSPGQRQGLEVKDGNGSLVDSEPLGHQIGVRLEKELEGEADTDWARRQTGMRSE